MENRLNIFIGHQTASLHERSESLSESQILRICEVMIADHDLTDIFGSGDRILVYDIYKIFSKASSEQYKEFLFS
jgi:DNA replicative helicase MCM subunit Mcm2 (Cdc46/Mcm family)